MNHSYEEDAHENVKSNKSLIMNRLKSDLMENLKEVKNLNEEKRGWIEGWNGRIHTDSWPLLLSDVKITINPCIRWAEKGRERERMESLSSHLIPFGSFLCLGSLIDIQLGLRSLFHVPFVFLLLINCFLPPSSSLDLHHSDAAADGTVGYSFFNLLLSLHLLCGKQGETFKFKTCKIFMHQG